MPAGSWLGGNLQAGLRAQAFLDKSMPFLYFYTSVCFIIR